MLIDKKLQNLLEKFENKIKFVQSNKIISS